MIRFYTVLFCFCISLHAFEPLKNSRIALFWDYGDSINSNEIVLMKEKVKGAFNNQLTFATELDSTPQWLKLHHLGYKRSCIVPFAKVYDKAVNTFMIIHYERAIVYGLPGTSSTFRAYIPGGPLVPIDLTDDDPDWCHRSSLSIDMYDEATGKRIYTFLSNKESPALNSYDQGEFNDNIESIAEDISENFFKPENWNLFTNPATVKSIRDTLSLITEIKKQLSYFFNIKSVSAGSIAVNICVNEYGKVTVLKPGNINSSADSLWNSFFKGFDLGRVQLPNDSALFTIKLHRKKYKDYSLVNGYYASIKGYRDMDEIWRILYWHIDQFVKDWKFISGNRSDEYLHVTFDINKSGTVENLIFVDGSQNALKRTRKNTKSINGWEFGNKGDDADTGTHIECLFSLENEKIGAGR